MNDNKKKPKANKANLYKLSNPHRDDDEEVPPDGLGLTDLEDRSFNKLKKIMFPYKHPYRKD